MDMTSAGFEWLEKSKGTATLLVGALLVALTLAFVAGGPAGAAPCPSCPDDGGGGGDTVAPTVTGVSPAENATNAFPSDSVTAVFSEDMDSTTITTSTFTLVREGATTPVAATVGYDSVSKTATLNPDADLDSLATYMATVTTGARDAAGNALAVLKTWKFTVK